MKRYTVKAGQHDFKPLNWWPFHFGITSKQYRVRFNESNLYEPLDSEHDFNKGAGWSYGYDVHKNSIRWGWRPDEGKIEICLYLYENGVRTISQSLIKVPINMDIFILLKYNGAIASVSTREFDSGNQDSISLPWKATIKRGLLNDLWFGGNKPAVRDMFIDMQVMN